MVRQLRSTLALLAEAMTVVIDLGFRLHLVFGSPQGFFKAILLCHFVFRLDVLRRVCTVEDECLKSKEVYSQVRQSGRRSQ